MVTPNVISDPKENVIDYECPECGNVFSLETDAGRKVCECGIILDCDLITCLSEGKIKDELLLW